MYTRLYRIIYILKYIYIYATPKIQCSYSSSGLHIIMVPKATITFKQCRERTGGSTQGNASQDMAYDTAMMDRVTGRYVGMDQWWALALRAPFDLPKRCRSLIEVNEVIHCFSIYFAVANILIDLAGSRSCHRNPDGSILLATYICWFWDLWKIFKSWPTVCPQRSGENYTITPKKRKVL
jgi:hypothetical protein